MASSGPTKPTSGITVFVKEEWKNDKLIYNIYPVKLMHLDYNFFMMNGMHVAYNFFMMMAFIWP